MNKNRGLTLWEGWLGIGRGEARGAGGEVKGRTVGEM